MDRASAARSISDQCSAESNLSISSPQNYLVSKFYPENGGREIPQNPNLFDEKFIQNHDIFNYFNEIDYFLFSFYFSKLVPILKHIYKSRKKISIKTIILTKL